VQRTRPLCSYPKQAVYSGAGDTNSASSYRCQ
jgi:feruloyl esterase